MKLAPGSRSLLDSLDGIGADERFVIATRISRRAMMRPNLLGYALVEFPRRPLRD